MGNFQIVVSAIAIPLTTVFRRNGGLGIPGRPSPSFALALPANNTRLDQFVQHAFHISEGLEKNLRREE